MAPPPWPTPLRLRPAAPGVEGGTDVAGGLTRNLTPLLQATRRSQPPRRGSPFTSRPRRRASAPDKDGWQRVLPQRPEQGTQAPRHETLGTQPAPAAAAAGARPRPRAVLDRCLNCLSTAHRVATCTRSPRCFNCRGINHFARDCKRSRVDAAAGDTSGAADVRFVRQRRGSPRTLRGAGGVTPSPPGSPDTPLGAHGRTPSPPVPDSDVDVTNSGPQGAPGSRLHECWRYLKRDACVDNAEASLRFSVVVQTRCGSSEVLIDDAR